MSTVFNNHGMCCPACGTDTNLKVEATVVAKLLPNGADTAGDLEWNDESHALCDNCGHEGPLASFSGRESKLARQLRIARNLLDETRDNRYVPCLDECDKLLGEGL